MLSHLSLRWVWITVIFLIAPSIYLNWSKLSLTENSINVFFQLILSVIAFVVCWTPYYVMVVWWDEQIISARFHLSKVFFPSCYVNERFFMDPEEAKKADIVLQKSLYLFACTNSCMNPIVYGIFNLKRNKTERNTVKKFTITFKTL